MKIEAVDDLPIEGDGFFAPEGRWAAFPAAGVGEAALLKFRRAAVGGLGGRLKQGVLEEGGEAIREGFDGHRAVIVHRPERLALVPDGLLTGKGEAAQVGVQIEPIAFLVTQVVRGGAGRVDSAAIAGAASGGAACGVGVLFRPEEKWDEVWVVDVHREILA